MVDDDTSFSLISAGGDMVTVYTPSNTEQHTDDFDLVFDDDEYFDEENQLLGDASDCSTSVTPSVYRHEFDLGRRYHSYKSGRYPLPNDSLEQQLEELKHHLMLEITEGHLFLSDIGDNPQKIIDIGTGAGTWAIDVADRYPSASVVGTDLSPIQPSWLPINCRMFVEDCEEDEWLHGTGFDLVHLRGVGDFLRKPEVVLSKVLWCLKTGGWVEFQDSALEIGCDDDSMTADDPLQRFMSLVTTGMRKLGCEQYGNANIAERLDRAGLSNVQTKEVKVPIGTWARDEKSKSLGGMMKAAIQESLDAFAAKPFEALGISPRERRDLVLKTKVSLQDDSIHRYAKIRFCFGQKGPQMVSDFDSDF